VTLPLEIPPRKPPSKKESALRSCSTASRSLSPEEMHRVEEFLIFAKASAAEIVGRRSMKEVRENTNTGVKLAR